MEDDATARRRVQVTTWATFGTLAAVVVVLLVVAQFVRIGGGTYDRISSANTLTADILPPPQYLVESQLLVNELALTPTGGQVDENVARLTELHHEYDDRHAYWLDHLDDPAQRQLLLGDGDKAAQEYFRVVEQQFVPALRAGDTATVTALATGQLHTLYEADRKAVDGLVPLANQTVVDATDRSTMYLWAGAAVLVACMVLMVVMVRRLSRRSLAALDESAAQKADLAVVLGEVMAQSGGLTSSSAELDAISQSMATMAEEAAAQAGVASAASEQVASSASTVAAAVEEMEVSIQEIATGAAGAADTAGRAVELSDATRATIAKLGESSAQITGVVDAIVAITEDTNILALNATIEAARAGEAGKGFAVVANEVKELAKQTARATEDIRDRVRKIQDDTTASVSAIAEVATVIDAICESQTTIASAVEQQRATAREMAVQVGEVAVAAHEISGSIGGVADAAHVTARNAAETQQAAAEVSATATHLESVATARN